MAESLKEKAADTLRRFIEIAGRFPSAVPPNERVREALEAITILCSVRPASQLPVPMETGVWIDLEVDNAVRFQRVHENEITDRLPLAATKRLMECAYLRGRRDREEEVVYDPQLHPARCKATSSTEDLRCVFTPHKGGRHVFGRVKP